MLDWVGVGLEVCNGTTAWMAVLIWALTSLLALMAKRFHAAHDP
jgi:hypothetical protein